ncbi:MAG: glycine zipper 2TM domain-containing protein [Pseudomonadota bacterium]
MYLKPVLALVVSGTILTACGNANAPSAADTVAADAATAAQTAAAAAEDATRKQAEADAASVAAAREAQYALQQSELKAKEAELAAREASVSRSAAAAKAAKPVTRPVAAAPVAAPVVNSRPVPRNVTVSSGTQLNAALASDVSTKSAKVGDSFRARLTSDVMAEGKVAIPSGTILVGQVTNVISGSDKIGAVPAISLHFSSLEYPGGHTQPISGDFTSTGKSEKGQDTAKIVGGAAAGAILGHQTNNKSSGTIIGGLLGAGAGTLAAKKTGSEVKLPSGTEIGVVLAEALRVQVK